MKGTLINTKHTKITKRHEAEGFVQSRDSLVSPLLMYVGAGLQPGPWPEGRR